MLKCEWVTIRDFVIGWFIASSLWMVARNYGVSMEGGEDPTLHEMVRLIFVFAPLAGVFFGFAQIKFERYLLRRTPMWKLSLYGILLNTVITTVLLIGVYNFFKYFIDFDRPTTFSQFIQYPNAHLLFFYSILVNFVLASIKEVNLLLGKGNLWRFIRGDFYSPRVENRVFMFIDLKGSTSIAEQLGHIRYSRFLQDCFYDLHVVQEYDAEVYQYVGDEVVLSWKVKKNMDYTRCLKAFWAYEEQLKKCEAIYMKKYGIVPQFKAGINIGEVTTAEVGEIKKEIAYHGDTMNIAARIQDKCNDFGKSLLISELFYESYLKQNNTIHQFELMGEELLRGKQQRIKIYAVHKSPAA